MTHKERVIAMLNSLRWMSDDLTLQLFKDLKPKRVKKGEYLLLKGQVCTHIYFIISGIFRCHYKDEFGNETTKWVLGPDNVIISVESFLLQTPTNEPIHALTNSLLYGITHEELYHLFDKYIEFNYHGRELMGRYYVLSEQRVSMLQRMNALARYQYVVQTTPKEIFDKWPKMHLASYLGIDPATLSRMTTTLKKRSPKKLPEKTAKKPAKKTRKQRN